MRLEQGLDVKASTLLAWIEKFEMPFEDLLYAANNYQLTGYQAILNNVAKSYGDNQKETLKQHLRNAKWYAESESKNERDKLNYLMSRSEVLFAMSNSFNW